MLTHCGSLPIESERLRLRPFASSDAAAVWRNWASNPEVQHRYCEPVYPHISDAEELLAKYIAGYQNPDVYRWAVTLRETDECIGQIAYFLVDSKNHFAELEYCVGQAFQRRGYITEAARSAVHFGFERIGLHRVQICHHDGNIASKKVIENCGLHYEGTLRDFFYEDGRYIGRCYYSILREEWEQRRG